MVPHEPVYRDDVEYRQLIMDVSDISATATHFRHVLFGRYDAVSREVQPGIVQDMQEARQILKTVRNALFWLVGIAGGIFVAVVSAVISSRLGVHLGR
jgi:hypothetical protein